MLKGNDIYETYLSMGATGERKNKGALERLKYLALYDDDMAIQEIAIRTIRKIGGRKALDVLRFLKRTDHKELIENVIKYGADY